MEQGALRFVHCVNTNIRVWRSGTRHGNSFVVFPDPPNLIDHHSNALQKLARYYDVYCIELPGFGYSSVSRQFSFSMPDYLAALSELFDKLGITKAHVEVSCLGALILLHMAKVYPHYFERLYLLQCCSVDASKTWLNTVDLLDIIKTPIIGQLFMKHLKSLVARNWYRAALGECHKDQYRAFVDPVIMAFRDGAQFQLADAYQQVLQLDGSTLEVPHDAMVIWGEDDRTHAASDKKSVLQHVPHADYITFPGCGHFPSLENMHDYLMLVQHD